MKATQTEKDILNRLLNCRYLPASFDKKFTKGIDVSNVSPLQKYWIYKLGYKYRKQIGNDAFEFICKNYIDNNQMPLSRKASNKILKEISKKETTQRKLRL